MAGNAKVDWARFDALRVVPVPPEGGITVGEYSEHYGCSVSTARRVLRDAAKTGVMQVHKLKQPTGGYNYYYVPVKQNAKVKTK